MGVACCKQSEKELEIKIPFNSLCMETKDNCLIVPRGSKRGFDLLKFNLSIYNKTDCTCSECPHDKKENVDFITEFESKGVSTLCVSKSNQMTPSKCCKSTLTAVEFKLRSIVMLQSYFRGIFYRRRFVPFIKMIVKKRSVLIVPPIKIPSSTKSKHEPKLHLDIIKNGREKNEAKSSISNGKIFCLDKARRRVSKFEMDVSKIYSGDMLNGKKDGFGILRWLDGSKYVGMFFDNQASGLGKQIHQNGEFYFGEWKIGRAEGLGYYFNSAGSKYEGEWKNDKQNGFGSEKWSESSNVAYQGTFLNGLKHGIGILELEDGSVYEGEFEDNLISGHGILKYKDKKVYFGSWKQNMMNGIGILSWEDGKHFEGTFIKDSKEGFGTYWCGGKIYLGIWQNNKLEGEVCIVEHDQIRNSFWKEGKKTKYLVTDSVYSELAASLT